MSLSSAVKDTAIHDVALSVAASPGSTAAERLLVPSNTVEPTGDAEGVCERVAAPEADTDCDALPDCVCDAVRA